MARRCTNRLIRQKLKMTATMLPRSFSLILSCMIILSVAALASPSHAQTVAVMVNGEPITNFDIEQRGKLNFLSTHKASTRQQIIDELIDEKVKIKEAKKFGIDPAASDVDSAYGSMSSRLRITPEQLTQSLESQGIRPDTLKSRLRADIVWGSLVRGRFKESLQVGEKDVQSAAAAIGDDKQSDGASFEYQLRPIVLIVPRGAAPATTEARRKEAETLRNRVQTCDEANDIFKTMQNAAIRDTLTKTSADIPAVLREVLDNTPIGHLTAPEVTKQGVEMVALCGRKPTTVDTPKKREARDKLFANKYEAKSKSYLNDVRKSAMIEFR